MHAIIEQVNAEKTAKYFKEEFLDKGSLGKQNGKGFYEYPNPAFEQKEYST